jgi:hypothetical protein
MVEARCRVPDRCPVFATASGAIEREVWRNGEGQNAHSSSTLWQKIGRLYPLSPSHVDPSMLAVFEVAFIALTGALLGLGLEIERLPATPLNGAIDDVNRPMIIEDALRECGSKTRAAERRSLARRRIQQMLRRRQLCRRAERLYLSGRGRFPSRLRRARWRCRKPVPAA